jgi:hypothetical protein
VKVKGESGNSGGYRVGEAMGRRRCSDGDIGESRWRDRPAGRSGNGQVAAMIGIQQVRGGASQISSG